ncbi:hypothetical protein A9Z40_11175 [Microbacterium arborescens]|uniref:Uncharacterized protein n=1 Tax=Microbacterium arborescens TaxID=33883 RepID=A0ABX2WLT5_9MICO|nr:hypothetical protein [Microbacterium arborescens]OAZ44466.1 hypothetical protein A9Z40_11175 [Microbacterium arborescens]
MSDTTPDPSGLHDAARDRTRRDQLAVHADAARRLVEQRESELADLQQKLRVETADVRRLERFSPAQVWGLLRGDIDDKLAVERAEQQAAEHAVDGATERLAHARADLARIEGEIAALGDVDAAYSAALGRREEELRVAGREAAAELTRLDVEAGELSAESHEITEAQVALGQAREALAVAQRDLDAAGGWSTYDTFFGGGMIADWMKHDRIGRSARAFAAVNRALETLATELADIDAPPVAGVQISESLAVFDVLFDNVISDFMVRQRIADAQAAASDLDLRLRGLKDYLAQRADAVSARTADLLSRRERLLLAP